MTDKILTRLCTEVLENHFPKKKFKLNAIFYTSKGLRHTIELKANTIQIRIADQLDTVPERILYILGIILLSKLFRYKLAREWRKEYNQYLDEFILPNHRPHTRKPSGKYTSKGIYFDLEKVFDEVNDQYFESAIKQPIIGWSLKKSYVRLGFYSNEKNLLVISRIFDSKKIPEAIVYFMMYHEMLHIYFPTTSKNGRRSIHPPEFKKMEKKFPQFEEIQRWIKKNRHKL